MATLVVTIMALGAIGWFAYLVGSGSRRERRDPVPANLSAAATDDEMETTRLDRTLMGAVVAAGFLTLAMPIYYLGEFGRQEGFVEEFAEASLERGHEVWDEFGCGDCHGAEGGGGVAAYLEERSKVNVSGWAAPPLNDIFFRYDRDEVRFWIAYGRANSPMPAWGLEGGGALNSQQIDDLLNYIGSFQVSQEDALLRIEGTVNGARNRLATAADSVATQIDDQRALVEEIADSGALSAVVSDIADRGRDILDGAGDGIDTDGDGLSDRAESGLTALGEEALQAGFLAVASSFDPRNSETLIGTSDSRSATRMVSDLESRATSLTITSQNRETLLEQAEFGLSFLEEAAQASRWEVDLEAVAEGSFNGNREEAERAAALFNGYCARCHTAGYSAGPAFQQVQAAGALGPSLRAGRSLTQFIEAEDMAEFVEKGSVSGEGYGVNGVGSGRMPGFGQVLSREDINLIVGYLRGPTLDGRE